MQRWRLQEGKGIPASKSWTLSSSHTILTQNSAPAPGLAVRTSTGHRGVAVPHWKGHPTRFNPPWSSFGKRQTHFPDSHLPATQTLRFPLTLASNPGEIPRVMPTGEGKGSAHPNAQLSPKFKSQLPAQAQQSPQLEFERESQLWMLLSTAGPKPLGNECFGSRKPRGYVTLLMSGL